jgi:hypothetical protein
MPLHSDDMFTYQLTKSVDHQITLLPFFSYTKLSLAFTNSILIQTLHLMQT